MERNKKSLTPLAALQKIRRYCAYQERSHKEVEAKLFSYGLYRDDIDQLMAQLITDNFLNEERFAKTYAGGKFRIKKWGKRKIVAGLKEKGIGERIIKIGLTEIENDNYEATLNQLAEKKWGELLGNTAPEKWKKASTFLFNKGYEGERIRETLNRLSKNE